MKENELDKYVGKRVEIIDFRNKTYEGSFYKIDNGWYTRCGETCQALIQNGYVMDVGYGYCNLRQSHIKKIRVIGGK